MGAPSRVDERFLEESAVLNAYGMEEVLPSLICIGRWCEWACDDRTTVINTRWPWVGLELRGDRPVHQLITVSAVIGNRTNSADRDSKS